jgi:hypothetical protein
LCILETPIIFSQEFEGMLTYVTVFTPKFEYGMTQNRNYTFYILYKQKKIKILKPFLRGNSLILDEEAYYYLDNQDILAHHTGFKADKNRMDSLPYFARKTKYKKKILGYDCEKYEVEPDFFGSDYESFEIWTNDSLKIGQTSFALLYYKDIGLVFKSIQKFTKFTVYTNLIGIKPMKLDDGIFELPDYPINDIDMREMVKAVMRSSR